MKRLKAFLLVLILCISAVNISSVFAAEQISVYLNGTELNYDDAKPQIINSRAMVPIRKTAEYLGMTVDWNAKTETMTFTKGDRTIVHTMRSTVIFVNGESFTFDTPSMNVQNRTLMPVRMLAEATGASVDWDNASRKVIITTGSPKITYAGLSKTVINSGETVSMTINANSYTDKVIVTDSSTGATIGENAVYTTNPDNSRVFTVMWTPYESSTISKTLTVKPGNSTGYFEDSTSIATVIANIMVDSAPKILNYSVDDTSVDRNDYVNLTIYGNASTSRVKITNNFQGSAVENTSHTNSENDRIFTSRVKMTKDGDAELYIYAGDDTGYQGTYETVKISVGDDSDNDDDDKDTREIKEIDVDSDEVAVGEKVSVRVTTTDDIEEVAIFNDNDKRLVKSAFPDEKNKSDHELEWLLEFEVSSGGTNKYYVYAYDDDQNKVKQSFKLTGEKYDKDELYVVSVEQRNKISKKGDTVKLNVKTTDVADYVVIQNSSGDEIAKTDSSSGSKNNTTWSLSFTLESVSKNVYYAYAYTDSGKKVSKKFSISVNSYDDPEIIDIDADSSVRVRKDIEVTVTTNDAVTKVWIEDEDGERVSKKTKYDEKDDDEYTWEFDFEAPDDEGKYTYTVYAENENGDTDEDTFKVKVND